MRDYDLPNGKPRKAWLRMGASLGENAHLPVFLANMRIPSDATTPKEIIAALTGQDVKLQLASKPRKGKQPFQYVIYDAVKPQLDGAPVDPGFLGTDPAEEDR
jgi:hypothetical protein